MKNDESWMKEYIVPLQKRRNIVMMIYLEHSGKI